jgi:hypothetical protein
MASMARNWLVSAELPSSFWFYALHRAAEVCIYLPYQLEDDLYTTLAHKPKLQFTSLNKFDSQSLPMIPIGHCPNSYGIQFSNPINGTFVSSIDYTFQNHVTSGTTFGYTYQPGTFIYRLDETTSIFSL